MFFLQEPLKGKCYFLIPDDQWKDTVRLAERNNCSIIFKNANDFGVLEEFTSFIQPLRFIISFLDQAPVPRDTSEYFCLNSNSLLTCISFKCAHGIYQSTIVCSDSCHQELNHLFRKSCVCVGREDFDNKLYLFQKIGYSKTCSIQTSTEFCFHLCIVLSLVTSQSYSINLSYNIFILFLGSSSVQH